MIITDLTLAEQTIVSDDSVTSVITAPVGATVIDGNAVITVTAAGAACGCGRGLYCTENDMRHFDATDHHDAVLWLMFHPVTETDRFDWEDGQQAEYDNLPTIGRRVYDQFRTQMGVDHVTAWLVCRREFGLRAAR